MGRVLDRLGRPEEARDIYQRVRELRRPVIQRGRRRSRIYPSRCRIAARRRAALRRSPRRCPGSTELAGDAFRRRSAGSTTQLEAGAAVVTGSGDLAAPFVLHVVIRDRAFARSGRDVVRRALVSAWQRAGDWALAVVAAPLVGADAGQLTIEEAAGAAGRDLSSAGCGGSSHRATDRGRAGRRSRDRSRPSYGGTA